MISHFASGQLRSLCGNIASLWHRPMIPRQQQLTSDVMQRRTTPLRPGLRGGSKSLQHFKSFQGPSDPSEADGQIGHRPSVRPSSRSAPRGDAPAHSGDALLVTPFNDQSGAMPYGRHCRKAHESTKKGPSPIIHRCGVLVQKGIDQDARGCFRRSQQASNRIFSSLPTGSPGPERPVAGGGGTPATTGEKRVEGRNSSGRTLSPLHSSNLPKKDGGSVRLMCPTCGEVSEQAISTTGSTISNTSALTRAARPIYKPTSKCASRTLQPDRFLSGPPKRAPASVVTHRA